MSIHKNKTCLRITSNKGTLLYMILMGRWIFCNPNNGWTTNWNYCDKIISLSHLFKLTTFTVDDNIQQFSNCQEHLLADTLTIPLMYNLILWNNFLTKMNLPHNINMEQAEIGRQMKWFNTNGWIEDFFWVFYLGCFYFKSIN